MNLRLDLVQPFYTYGLISLGPDPPGPLYRALISTHRLIFYAVTCADPYTLQAKSVPLPMKLGEVLRHKHSSDCNSSIHAREVKALT